VLHADVLAEPPDAFAERLRGRRVADVGRRGKNVVFHLEGGGVLLVNLGMTGRLLTVAAGGASTATHPALRFALEGGRTLVYDDVRRFGRVEALDAAGWAERSAALGPEPLDPGFTAADLAAGLSRSRSPVRSWLLDQRRVAGVGNIYANEALHRAGVHPARPADSLSREEARALHRALRAVLREAIRARGTTLRDYRTAEGGRGGYGVRLRVYGRDGEPCPRCNSAVERLVFANRSAFLCPRCQPGAEPGS
ncbi:MAG: bifunctional DNA-formamidopyrimidine glycosylase/DNA-(apurinic or apyrimidinic site) lyase, partial [Gemmatimonadetes bacterium]|nr:bifunctional DNA-formamidopyrimidine glycosylase/DNA-(apurinic or apyrimidinic site) lyase [Gemmatimonadota bacterium]